MDRETELRQQIDAISAELDAEWKRLTKPLLDELNEITAKNPQPTVVVALGSANPLGDFLSAIIGASGDGPCGDPNCPFCGDGERKVH